MSGWWIARAVAAGPLIVLASMMLGPLQADGPEKSDGPKKKPAAKLSPMSVNAACCICHMTFVREPISKVHLKAKVTCIKCHGLSADHANDEDIGATKPEIVYKRGQIDKMCVECHETHDAPARLVVARCIQRGLSPKKAAVCTDCHGKHRIEKPPADEKPAENTPPAGE